MAEHAMKQEPDYPFWKQPQIGALPNSHRVRKRNSVLASGSKAHSRE